MKSERDKVLDEIIAWADQRRKIVRSISESLGHDGLAKDTESYDGLITAFDVIVRHCETALGYDISMSLNAKNQSEEEK